LEEQFYKNRRIIFAQNLRTIPALADEQSLKVLIKVMYKTAASAAQFAKCLLLHTYLHTTVTRSCMSTNKLHIAYLISWHNSIFGFIIKNNIRIMRLNILKKLRTASLNS